MVRETDDIWGTFINEALVVAQELEAGTLSLKDALSRMMDAAPGVAPKAEEFILNTFSEIDGFPDDYEEVIKLMKSRPSQKEIEDFMKES